MVYVPEPPFDSGTPETAPAAIVEQARQSVRADAAGANGTARSCQARHRRPGRERGKAVWREPRVYWHARQRSCS
jgi:hypothetical protein